MFIKNDTALFRARRTVIALLWVTGILFVIAGIILCVLAFLPQLAPQLCTERWVGEFNLGMLIGGCSLILFIPIICYFIWIFANLRFTQMFDLKLIRNKLYGIYDPQIFKYVMSKYERQLQNNSFTDLHHQP